jgi:RNAse (barnase) inhibitor barstar
MRTITLDAGDWRSADDFYDAFFTAVGAPSWHGRNFNALRDGIAVGQINKIEVPYLIRILNYSRMGDQLKPLASDFVALINELRAGGCAVEIEVADGE